MMVPARLTGNPKNNNQTINWKFDPKIKKQSNLIEHSAFFIKKPSNFDNLDPWGDMGGPPGVDIFKFGCFLIKND